MLNTFSLADSNAKHSNTRYQKIIRYTVAAFMSVASIVVIYIIIDTDKKNISLNQLAYENLSVSGVDNPVTAVLLNYRSYDTLLEIAVLLVVACVFLSSSNTFKKYNEPRQYIENPSVLDSLLPWVVPFMIITSGYILWTGAFSPGGAFQAGSILAASGLLLSVTNRFSFVWCRWFAKISIVLGLAMFLLVGFTMVWIGGEFLLYPIEQASLLILIIEICATLSIASTLVLLFDGLLLKKADFK